MRLRNFFLAVLLIWFPPNAKILSQEFYVAQNGDDANPGTEALPWLTLQKACDNATPGSTVYVKAGIFNEQIEINVSGSAAEGFITFRNFESDLVAIDGLGFGQSGDQEAMVSIVNRDYIRFQGCEIRNLSSAQQDATMIGIYISGQGENIEILDNFVHHIASTAQVDGQLNGRDAHGILIEGTNGSNSLRGLAINNNEIANCTLGSSEAVVLNGNVDGFVIANNAVHDNDNIGIDLIGFEGTAPTNDRARNGIVSSNEVFNNSVAGNPSYPNDDYSAGGIYVDGGLNIVVERNRVHGNDLGVEVASESPVGTTDNVVVRSNLIYRNNRSGLSFGGFDVDRGTTLNCSFHNNTLFENDMILSGSGEISVNKAMENSARSNVIVANSQKLFLVGSFGGAISSNNEFDYNLYFGPNGATNAVFVWEGTIHDGFDAFVAATNQDARSAFDDPVFVDAGAFDFRLPAGSPAVDGGDPLFAPPAEELDFYGGMRVRGGRVDMGAAEFNSGSASSSVGSRVWLKSR